jgi:hypothetical protein
MKRGNRYLRKQLVDGARELSYFVAKVKRTRYVALTARLARLAWTLMQRNMMYPLGFKSFVTLPW